LEEAVIYFYRCYYAGYNNNKYRVLTLQVSAFLLYAQKQSESFRTNNIMIPMGHDFAYQNASTWFTPIDALIK